MASDPKVSRDVLRNSNASTEPTLERRTTSSTVPGTKNRYSFASSETGESSTGASRRNSLTKTSVDEELGRANGSNGGLDHGRMDKVMRDGMGSHRSHKNRNSGGFLLSNATFTIATDQAGPTSMTDYKRTSPRDSKGKTPLQVPKKRDAKRRSYNGQVVGGSPLAATVTSAGGPGEHAINRLGGDSTMESAESRGGNPSGSIPANSGLDVDSAQIVNLALNLSESRRNARRVISTPLPPATAALGEGFASGSLRQHLQQQRRASRNISPKPDRGERAITASPRLVSGQRINSPLQTVFDTHQDGAYQYHFSASTLARAEKAKNAIELMAQFRRLLQHVPPLRPQAVERPTTASHAGISPGSPMSSAPASRTVSASIPIARPLGREYNPLQYIRNRKVRLRERRGIEGEAQGFGNIDKVSRWVDAVSKEASSNEYQAVDCLIMPTLSDDADAGASPHASPQSTLGKSQAAAPAKGKRPRNDWYTNPADSLADVFWLEQDNNKKCIEDSQGRKIFPQYTELKRPMSRKSDGPEPKISPVPIAKKTEPRNDLRIDTKLPEFNSVKSDSDKVSDSATSRARQRIRDAARLRHGHNGSVREQRRLFRSHSRSGPDSSDSEAVRGVRRRRNRTVNNHDRSKDILEKQMMEMLAKEALENDWDAPHALQGKYIVKSIEPQKFGLNEEHEKSSSGKDSHSRSNSRVTGREPQVKSHSRHHSSGRPSLEVPGARPRASLEGLDSTAPNSPVVRASKSSNVFVPSLGMNLSPPRSRQGSPTRKSLAKVRSKIDPFFERSRDHSRIKNDIDNTGATEQMPSSKEQTPESPDTPEKRKRSMSPVKKVGTHESSRSTRQAGSLRRGKADEASGIRGLFKRGPVARVGDFLWKKEPGVVISSGFSTDESDVDDARMIGANTDGKKRSRDTSTEPDVDDIEEASPKKERSSFLREMPIFTSPFERRGRPIRSRADNDSPEVDSQAQRIEKWDEERRYSSGRRLEPPPRIDVQNASPTSSREGSPDIRYRDDSDASDVESRRGSSRVQNADARLNAILGLPGKRRNALPVTGLSSLETSHPKRPSLSGKRHWSISDQGVSIHRGPMTKREIARIRALFLCSGIKAQEISRRAAELRDNSNPDHVPKVYVEVAALSQSAVMRVPKSQQHRLAARILSNDIQLSSQMWQSSADVFTNTTIQSLLDRIKNLQSHIADQLIPMTRQAADDADEVSRDLVTSQTLAVKRLADSMERMMRRRRRRFRWLRRGGWVLLEWALVGIMWYVWFMVVLARIVMGTGRGIIGFGRWLFWL